MIDQCIGSDGNNGQHIDDFLFGELSLAYHFAKIGATKKAMIGINQIITLRLLAFKRVFHTIK